MTIWIDNETLLRVNIHAPYKGYSRLDTPEIRAAAGVVEIPDPVPPENYSDDTYYRTEQQDAPYVIWTLKPQKQIDELHNRKVWAAISALETAGGLNRTLREVLLELPGASGKGWHAKVKKLEDDVSALKLTLRVIL